MDFEEENMEGNCGAHEMFANELMRVKQNQTDLYNLDRKKMEEISLMQSKLAAIEEGQKGTKEDVAELKNGQKEMTKEITAVKSDVSDVKLKVEKVESKVDNVESKVDSVESKVDSVKEEVIRELKTLKSSQAKKQWTPKDYCVIIVAFLSLAGTIVTCLLK